VNGDDDGNSAWHSVMDHDTLWFSASYLAVLQSLRGLRVATVSQSQSNH